ncbi:MAG TPA: ATP-binding protein [Candidatus Angelobacter sp.]|nr:ATP-binding protein [Candidatus Angelobacter sp.]
MHAARQFFLIGILGLAFTALAAEADTTDRLPASGPGDAQTFEGTVTLVDTNRGLIVLQDASHSVGLNLRSIDEPVHVGDRIQMEGQVSPYFSSFPDYPDRPSGREIAGSFEAPTDWAKHYLTRMRGFLRPPADGDYTFWIAGDDEAELFLSSDREVTNAEKIAYTPRATWPREWERYPTQKSDPIFLKAGELYYIEALQRQWRGHDCLAVAWEGPGIQQSVIDGRYLLPDGSNLAGATHGILREYWTNFFLTTLAMLVPEPQDESVSLNEPRLKVLKSGNLPRPALIRIGEPWGETNNFQWAEVEGRSTFVANNNGMLRLEITNLDGRMTAHVFNWGTNSTVLLENRKLRLRGVCESVANEKGDAVAGTLWVPDARQISLLNFTDKDWNGSEPVAIIDLVPSNPNLAWGRRVSVRGTVLEHNPETEAVPIQGDDSFYGYISDDGTNWSPVGVPVSLAMSNSVYAGLAVSCMANYSLPSAVFDGGIDLPLKDSAESSLPYSNATITIQTGSGGIDDTKEKCNFSFENKPGEMEIVAQINQFHGAHVSDKAGIMIRESLEETSPSVSLMVTPESKIRLQYQIPGGSSRVVSLVLNRAPRWLKLVRRRHQLMVLPRQDEDFPPNQPVEIVGNLTWQNNLPVLTDASMRPVPAIDSLAEKLADSSKTEDIHIRDLPAEAKEGLQYASHSFRIRGVVTFSDRLFNRNLLFVQDDSGGALMRVLPEMAQHKPLEAGQFIEAEGSVTFTRGAAPFGIISATVLGLGEMPSPMPFPSALANDAEGQWVQAQGIVRAADRDGTLLLMEKDGGIQVWLKGADTNSLDRYVDALVQVRGVYTKRVQSHPMLLVPSLDYLQVKEAPPANPFIIPAFTIGQAGALDADPQTLHRLKITGVVTYRDDNLLFVQDATSSVSILTSAPNDVQVGDHVEAIGFPEKRSGSLGLTEAMVRKTGKGTPPQPAMLSPADVAEGRFNGSVVRLDGTLLEEKNREGEQTLELQTGQLVFQALLARSAGRMPHYPLGSRVQITGVNRVQFANHVNAKTSQQDNPMPATVDVLLRAPADVVLLQRPPWWNWKYTAGVSALCLVAFAISVIWIRTLRRRVEERTHELKDAMARLQRETETSATLVERDRLAGEIHDSLEQGLNGIMMQLDGVDSKLNEDANGARHYLEMARNMVRFSRAEVRHSLWNLESELLSNGNLGAALTEIARQMSSGNRFEIAIQVLGSAVQLPPATEHHLLRICQEALNNALKHANARTIQITLKYSEKFVQLTVADDGCGFAPDQVMTGRGMHLGLRNLRSRARKIKGRLEVVSQPSQGTSIDVTVPIGAPMDGLTAHN